MRIAANTIVEVVRLRPITLLDNPCGYPDRHRSCRDVAGYHGVGANNTTIANVNPCQNADFRPKPDIVADTDRRRGRALFSYGAIYRTKHMVIITNRDIFSNEAIFADGYRLGATDRRAIADKGIVPNTQDTGALDIDILLYFDARSKLDTAAIQRP